MLFSAIKRKRRRRLRNVNPPVSVGVRLLESDNDRKLENNSSRKIESSQ